jgi:hypothetical protein
MEDDFKIFEYNSKPKSMARNQKLLKSKIDLNKFDNEREIIDKKFSDPNKYLELDDKVIIGNILT